MKISKPCIWTKKKTSKASAGHAYCLCEGMIQGAGIPYAIVLYHVKGNDDREKIEYDKNSGNCSCASSLPI